MTSARRAPARVRFTAEARSDLRRLHRFLLDRDPLIADEALAAIRQGLGLASYSPFSCRKAVPSDSTLRELVVPFKSTGYLVLFRIERRDLLTILGVRHQREDDYY